MSRIVFLTGLALTLQLLTHVEATDKWPQFRGSRAGVADDDPLLPDRWSETENIAWKIDIPGQSWSSPVVWRDHVFVTSAISADKEPSPTRGLADLAVKDRLVYVADGAPGLQVVDLTTPSSPRIVGTFKTASPARDVAIAGSLVFVALGGGEVQILREGG